MYICMYLPMRLYANMSMYIYAHIWYINISIYICVFAYECIHICVRECICMRVCGICAGVCVCVCSCVFVCVCADICVIYLYNLIQIRDKGTKTLDLRLRDGQ